MTAAFSYSFEIGAANGALEKNVCQTLDRYGLVIKSRADYRIAESGGNHE